MTSLGIGLAVGLVVLLLALSAGIETSATTLATQSGVDLIAVSGNASSPLEGQFPPIQGAHKLVTEIPAIDPNVATASPWLLSDLVFGNASLWAAANSSDVPSGWSPTQSGAVGCGILYFSCIDLLPRSYRACRHDSTRPPVASNVVSYRLLTQC